MALVNNPYWDIYRMNKDSNIKLYIKLYFGKNIRIYLQKTLAMSDKRKAHKNTIDSVRKQVIQWTLRGSFVKKWGSISEAASALDLDQGHISKCCQNVRKSHGGYKWSYDLEYVPFRKESEST